MILDKSPAPHVRHIALMEGVSFLILLGIAMPLKYFAGMPAAVKVAGWAHGIIFVALCYDLWKLFTTLYWPFKRVALVFISALLPFGPFVLHRRMVEWEKKETL